MFLKKSFYLTISEVNSMYIERDFDCTQLSVGVGGTPIWKVRGCSSSRLWVWISGFGLTWGVHSKTGWKINFFFNSFYLLDSCNHSLKWSLLGVKNRLGHAQSGLHFWFNSKFPTSIPAPFIWDPPPPFWGVYPSDDDVAWPLRLGEHCCYLANERGFPSFTEWPAQ